MGKRAEWSERAQGGRKAAAAAAAGAGKQAESWGGPEPPKARTTVLFRMLNPELYVRANRTSLALGLVGAGVCVGIAGYSYVKNMYFPDPSAVEVASREAAAAGLPPPSAAAAPRPAPKFATSAGDPPAR